MIPSELSNMYEYAFDQDDESVTVTIPLKPSFDPKRLQVQLSENKDGLMVNIQDIEVPVIACGFPYPVTSIETKSTSTEFTIQLNKAEKHKWAALCDDYYPGTEDVDPLSAFTIFKLFSSSSDENKSCNAIYFFDMSVKMGYLPALKQAYLKYSDDPTKSQEVENWMKIAAERYGDIRSMITLGTKMAKHPDTQKEAMELFQKALDSGDVDAETCMGKMYSPCSDFCWDEKDAAKAFSIFTTVIQIKEDPIALHELAKLYLNGIGVKQNIKMARQLQKRAKRVNKYTPKLPKTKQAKIALATVITVGSVAVITGLVFYCMIRRRNK